MVRSFALDLADHDAFGAAASIAFWFFLSLVPLLVLVGFLAGQVARVRGIDALLAPLLDVVPGTAEGLVGKELERLAGAHAPSIAPLGVVGFLWTASSGLHNLMDVFEIAANAKRRPWWSQRAISLVWVVVGLSTACALAWILVKTDAVMQVEQPAPPTASVAAPSRPNERSSQARAAPAAAASRAAAHGALRGRVHKALQAPGVEAVATTLLLVAGTTLLAGFYRFAVVHPRGVRRRIWPGAVTAVVSWLVVSWGFGGYAVSIADYALYYGSLAAVAVLLVWLYLTSLSLVVGAEVNARLEGIRTG